MSDYDAGLVISELKMFDGLFSFVEWETADMFGGVTFFECTLLKDLYPFKKNDVVDTIRWDFGNHTLTLDTGRYFVDYDVSFNLKNKIS